MLKQQNHTWNRKYTGNNNNQGWETKHKRALNKTYAAKKVVFRCTVLLFWNTQYSAHFSTFTVIIIKIKKSVLVCMSHLTSADGRSNSVCLIFHCGFCLIVAYLSDMLGLLAFFSFCRWWVGLYHVWSTGNTGVFCRVTQVSQCGSLSKGVSKLQTSQLTTQQTLLNMYLLHV